MNGNDERVREREREREFLGSWFNYLIKFWPIHSFSYVPTLYRFWCIKHGWISSFNNEKRNDTRTENWKRKRSRSAPRKWSYFSGWFNDLYIRCLLGPYVEEYAAFCDKCVSYSVCAFFEVDICSLGRRDEWSVCRVTCADRSALMDSSEFVVGRIFIQAVFFGFHSLRI